MDEKSSFIIRITGVSNPFYYPNISLSISDLKRKERYSKKIIRFYLKFSYSFFLLYLIIFRFYFLFLCILSVLPRLLAQILPGFILLMNSFYFISLISWVKFSLIAQCSPLLHSFLNEYFLYMCGFLTFDHRQFSLYLISHIFYFIINSMDTHL